MSLTVMPDFLTLWEGWKLRSPAGPKGGRRKESGLNTASQPPAVTGLSPLGPKPLHPNIALQDATRREII